MARPEKIGLDYFPFDIDFFEDEKIEAISGEFGIKGEIVAIKLLCAVYRNGYFVRWNDMLKMKLVKHSPGISHELLDQILNRLVKWEFFNSDLFNSDNILTSKGIQSRFFQATKRRNSKDEFPFLLVNACRNSVNVYNNKQEEELLHAKNTQSKEEKSKEDNSHTNARVQTGFPSPAIFDKPLLELHAELLNSPIWLEDICRRVYSEGFSPFTLDDCISYLDKFILKLRSEGEDTKSEVDAKKHFPNWIIKELRKQRDDRRRTQAIGTTAGNTAGKFVRGETEKATDTQSGETPQKDYSGSF